ncbi:hypothetical protein ACFLSJ_03490 [Verrucomicrobiota bacterium]
MTRVRQAAASGMSVGCEGVWQGGNPASRTRAIGLFTAQLRVQVIAV